MLLKQMTQAVLFAALLGAVALGWPREAQALSWTKMTVDETGAVGEHASVAVDANGDPMISYYDGTNDDLKFAICDMSATGCDATGDWKKTTVDDPTDTDVGWYTSIAAASGKAMISYYDVTNQDLKFAVCDLSSGCDDTADWGTPVKVDGMGVNVGGWTSIAADSGKAMISYFDDTNDDLKFAICDLSTGCDATGEWGTPVKVDGTEAAVGIDTSIAAGSGKAMISYFDDTNDDLKFAICTLSTGCDDTAEWGTPVMVDGTGVSVGMYTSIATNASGNPTISYWDIGNTNLKFAICDLSAAGCNETVDWTSETVDAAGDVGRYSSIAVQANGRPVISYMEVLPSDLNLKFAFAPAYFPPAGTEYYDVTLTAHIFLVNPPYPPQDKGTLVATGTAKVTRGNPYWSGGQQCADYHIESLTLRGTLGTTFVEIRVGEGLTVPGSSGVICEGAAGFDVTLSLYVEEWHEGASLASSGSALATSEPVTCSCEYEPGRWSSIECTAVVSEVPPNQITYDCGDGYDLCYCGTDTERVRVDNPDTGGLLLTLVGGIAELPGATVGSDSLADSSAGSGFNYTALGAALGAAAVALAAGAWLTRRRWGR